MANSWGGAWGSSWGASWGEAAAATSDRGDGVGSSRKKRQFVREIVTRQEYLRKVLGFKEEPQPTAKARKIVAREIVSEIEAGGLGVARPQVQTFVRQRLAQEWRPGTDWQALAAVVRSVMAQAKAEAERIEQENEDDDEFILLMAA